MPEVVWTQGAKADLLQTFARFEDIRDGMGTQFVAEVDRMLELVKNNPRIASAYEPPSRKLLVRKCKYGVIYVPEARGIVVLAVAYLGQNPDALRGKVRKMLGLE